MASFLIDENISTIVAEQLLRDNPSASIISIHHWHNGKFCGVEDEIILKEACIEMLTLITYDLKTIRPVLKMWNEIGQDHAGVIFIDDKSIANNDYGALIKSILQIYMQLKDTDFKNRIHFLQRVV